MKPQTPTSELPKCTVCNAPLRPYKAPLSKWPGTKAKVSTRPLLCSAHQAGRGTSTVTFTGHSIPQIREEDVRIVKRMIRERFEGDDYLLILTSIVGDDID